MNFKLMLTLAATLAQTANPLSAEAKQAYGAIKTNMIKMAEKMPEELYSYQPVPEIRTFGQLIAHVADSQLRNCTTVNGEAKTGAAAKKTAKADLVAALKEGAAACDAAFDALTDASATAMVPFRNGQRSKLGVLNANTIHLNEEYGYMAVYLRLKSVVPPSSEGR